MNRQQLCDWCARYKASWECQNADLFVTLFSTDCLYRVTPFTEPVPARLFHGFWSELARIQRDNRIDFEVLAEAGPGRFVLRWDANSTRCETGLRRKGSGIFLLAFDSQGRCSDLLEWQHWHPASAPLERLDWVPGMAGSAA